MSRRYVTSPPIQTLVAVALGVSFAVTFAATVPLVGRVSTQITQSSRQPRYQTRHSGSALPEETEETAKNRLRSRRSICPSWFCDLEILLAIALWGATALEVAALIWVMYRLYRAPAEEQPAAAPSDEPVQAEPANDRLVRPDRRETALLEYLEREGDWIPWTLKLQPLAVVACLPNGQIVACNATLLALSECDRASALGQHYLDLCCIPDDRSGARAAIARADSSSWETFHGRTSGRNGRWSSIEWHVRQTTIDPAYLTETGDTAEEDADPDRDAARDAVPSRDPVEPIEPVEVYVYLGRETTEQQRRDALSLQAELVHQTLMAPTFEKALRAMLSCWCDRLPWEYGEAWVLDPDLKTPDLALSYPHRTAADLPIAQSSHDVLHDLTRKTDDRSYIRTALHNRQPCYLPRLDRLETEAFGQRDLALASGFNCCAILPLDIGQSVIICLLFANHHDAMLAQSLPSLDRTIPQLELALQRQQTIATALNACNQQRRIFENAVEGLFQISPRGSYLNVNQALARIFGFRAPNELIDELTSIEKQFVTESRYAKFERHLYSSGSLERFTAEMYRRDGSTIWVEIVARAVFDETEDILYAEGSVVDITERQRTEDKLRYSATHDALTGLWNRAWFVEQLQRILKRARRYDSYAFAVFFIDLNNFKLINDTLGHMVRDRLLVALSQRLNGALQQGQSLARLGGDEFTLSIDRITDANEAIAIAKKLCQQLEQPFQIGAHDLYAQASIGIVIGSRQYETPEMVLRDADIAMYSAKAGAKSGDGATSHYVLFDTEMGQASQRRLRLEDDLRRAIEYDELSLHYQPIVDISRMVTIGFEVLLRWEHPEYGPISPGEFIPLAEESGAIVKIGEWVMWEACRQLQTWKRNGLPAGQVAMSVNVSSRQLSSGLIAHIDRALETFDIQPGELKIEITETVVMSDLSQARFVLRQIEDRQIPILLDDFGTGYCSLNYLYELPIDTLKIDRSFVRTIDERTERRQVLDTIFQLAESLDLKVIAEGVENAEQLAYLERQRRCCVQGYLFSKPVPAAIAQTLLGEAWSQIAV